LHQAKKRTGFRNAASEVGGIRSTAAVEDEPTRNQQAIDLLRQWLADESGYDERVWPEVKKSIEEHLSLAKTPPA
jgi:hypothetical protein